MNELTSIPDPYEERYMATRHYKKRKLERAIEKYIKDNRVIKSSEIEAIGQKHKFYLT